MMDINIIVMAKKYSQRRNKHKQKQGYQVIALIDKEWHLIETVLDSECGGEDRAFHTAHELRIAMWEHEEEENTITQITVKRV